jgi:hypothetical protein
VKNRIEAGCHGMQPTAPRESTALRLMPKRCVPRRQEEPVEGNRVGKLGVLRLESRGVPSTV